MIDAHAHVELSTLADHFWVEVRELSVDATLDRLRAAVAAAAPEEWVVGQGTFGQPMPSRVQLDAIAPHNPLVLRQSMHIQVANSAALARAGVDQRFLSPVAIRAQRDAAGEHTGVIEEGFDLFPIPRPAEEALAAALAAHVAHGWVRHGVTTIHELPASTGGVRAWQRLSAAQELPCRIVLNPILEPGHQATVANVTDFVRLGFATGFGDDWLHLGSLKLFLDGVGCGALYHAMLATDAREWGLQGYLYQELVGILGACRDARVQVWMHAIGDAAHSMAMDAVDEVNVAHGSGDHRTRIEHIGLAVTQWDHLPRLRDAGIIPVPTAAFMHFEPDDREAALPSGSRIYPYRSLLEQGHCPPGNSDSAGTQPFATNPWHGVMMMMLRRNRNGVAFSSDEAVDVDAAVRTYTRNGAYVGFEEHLKGSLEVGKLGDLAVYADDPYGLDPEALPDLEADLTIIGGTIAHDRTRALAAP
jgi:predicted amidohydrolase YtcJ